MEEISRACAKLNIRRLRAVEEIFEHYLSRMIDLTEEDSKLLASVFKSFVKLDYKNQEHVKLLGDELSAFHHLKRFGGQDFCQLLWTWTMKKQKDTEIIDKICFEACQQDKIEKMNCESLSEMTYLISKFEFLDKCYLEIVTNKLISICTHKSHKFKEKDVILLLKGWDRLNYSDKEKMRVILGSVAWEKLVFQKGDMRRVTLAKDSLK